MNDRKKQSLRGWISFLGVVYRLAIILGLLFSLGAAIVIFLTRIFPLWILGLPFSLIVFGVILARIEYRLYRKLERS